MHTLSEIVGRPLQICLLTQDEELAASLRQLWPQDQIDWTVFSGGCSALDRIFSDPPDMVIADQCLPDVSGIDVLHMLKKENVYRQICAVLIAGGEHLSALPHGGLHVDELITLPASTEELRTRVALALYRTTVTLDANPLTRLPGNTSIINTAQRLMLNGTDFTLAYVDLDNFKPYNDKYGFSRGDEVLLMAARLIANTVAECRCQPAFTGHIGGDDFVFILPPAVMEEACRSLIRDFDAIVPGFYDPEDKKRGHITSRDRQGRELNFPILSISIAVVPNHQTKYSRYAQLAHAAGQLKSVAKTTRGSSYVINRRH